ncbi:alpha/beta hydrolase [Actomonas aquatica]|uniref:Alpha/beta hydrolase n=1 Tax=Actomonas aquatica TaxID=2866162 RepID=A0ABZ1C862_9BACT|nr:alpha/beta hydrolase [Opitutus sp. WL0086]WRQ87869.1 alpha/beta hydrolase [Opitutus sp. WL0086]
MRSQQILSLVLAWAVAPLSAALSYGQNTPATPTSFPGADTVIYRDAQPEPVRLHIVKPAGWKPTDRRPALVKFFGGGWQHGTPEKSIGGARAAARLGMVGFAPDYRVVQRWPDSDASHTVADARRAIRWIQDHADELGVDPQRIIVVGSSAGAHLALWTAITTSPPELTEEEEAPRFKPAALILSSPPSDTSAATGVGGDRFNVAEPDRYSPLQHLDATMPPVLLIHGDADRLVPFAQSVALHAALVATGNTCEFHPVPGGGHNYTQDVPSWKRKVPELQSDFLTRLHLLPVANED